MLLWVDASRVLVCWGMLVVFAFLATEDKSKQLCTLRW